MTDQIQTELTHEEMDFHIFIPLSKVDAQRHEVWGISTIEQADHADEILDYASSKPYFQKWSQDYAKRTDGKSLGNVREMHENIAAGKLIAINFDDARKSIPIGVKVVNDPSWQKVDEGVLTGFSVGGKYIKKWYDAQTGMMRYTAEPREISLVDAPCVPGATFQMVKMDGSIEERAFKKVTTPAITPMSISTEKGSKAGETFSPVSLSVPAGTNITITIPSTPTLQQAGNPNQQKVDGLVVASPATDNSPVAGEPASLNSADYAIAPNSVVKTDEPAPVKPTNEPAVILITTVVEMFNKIHGHKRATPEIVTEGRKLAALCCEATAEKYQYSAASNTIVRADIAQKE